MNHLLAHCVNYQIHNPITTAAPAAVAIAVRSVLLCSLTGPHFSPSLIRSGVRNLPEQQSGKIQSTSTWLFRTTEASAHAGPIRSIPALPHSSLRYAGHSVPSGSQESLCAAWKFLSKVRPMLMPAAAMLSSSAALQDIPQAGKTAQPGKVWNSAKLQTRN